MIRKFNTGTGKYELEKLIRADVGDLLFATDTDFGFSQLAKEIDIDNDNDTATNGNPLVVIPSQLGGVRDDLLLEIDKANLRGWTFSDNEVVTKTTEDEQFSLDVISLNTSTKNTYYTMNYSDNSSNTFGLLESIGNLTTSESAKFQSRILTVSSKNGSWFNIENDGVGTSMLYPILTGTGDNIEKVEKASFMFDFAIKKWVLLSYSKVLESKKWSSILIEYPTQRLDTDLINIDIDFLNTKNSNVYYETGYQGALPTTLGVLNSIGNTGLTNYDKLSGRRFSVNALSDSFFTIENGGTATTGFKSIKTGKNANIDNVVSAEFIYNPLSELWNLVSYSTKDVGGGGLPTGLVNETLRHNGTDWVANDVLQISESGITVKDTTLNKTVLHSTKTDFEVTLYETGNVNYRANMRVASNHFYMNLFNITGATRIGSIGFDLLGFQLKLGAGISRFALDTDANMFLTSLKSATDKHNTLISDDTGLIKKAPKNIAVVEADTVNTSSTNFVQPNDFSLNLLANTTYVIDYEFNTKFLDGEAFTNSVQFELNPNSGYLQDYSSMFASYYGNDSSLPELYLVGTLGRSSIAYFNPNTSNKIQVNTPYTTDLENFYICTKGSLTIKCGATDTTFDVGFAKLTSVGSFVTLQKGSYIKATMQND